MNNNATMEISKKELLNVSEASGLIGWSESHLRKLARDKVIRSYKPGGKCIFFETADLLNFIRSEGK